MRKAWEWPNNIKPSQWAEENRIVSAGVSVEPGPWRGERTPYLAEIGDTVVRPGVDEVVFLKAHQLGYGEEETNLLGYAIDRDPGPALLVMPSEKAAEEIIAERVTPLLNDTPAVARHSTGRAWDSKKASIRLATMRVFVGWAGSSQSLKTRAIKWLFIDEPDDYVKFSGAGGDPIAKAIKRTTTYAGKGLARIIIGGTPTTRRGNIWKRWSLCTDKRFFFVPCPHCGKYQKLEWAQFKYLPRLPNEEPQEHALRVQDQGGAWYECVAPLCKGKITEAQKPSMMTRGKYVGSDQVITPDGRVVGGEGRRHRRIGFCVNGLYSPWLSWAKIAAGWIEAQGDTEVLCDFVNQVLAQPFEEQREVTKPEVIRRKVQTLTAEGIWTPNADAPPPLIVPKWAKLLVSTADTQGNNESDGYFWRVTRAWDYGYRSQLVDFGVSHSKAELRADTIDKHFQLEGTSSLVQPRALFIDTGGPRFLEIYQMAQADNRIKPTKGVAPGQMEMVKGKILKAHQILLLMIDASQAKDLLHRLIHNPNDRLWMPHAAIDAAYAAQMSSQAKVYDPRAGKELWTEIVQDNDHLWDCYDKEMEVLTRSGWKIFADVKKSDQLATVNLDTDALEYQRPSKLIAKPHNGPMIQIGGGKGSRLDMLVTPTHRMVVYPRDSSGKSGPVIKLAKDLTIWDKLKLTATWKGNGVRSITLPAARAKPAATVDAIDLARFLGWYMAEGYCRKNGNYTRVVIYQNRGEKRERIRAIINRLKWVYVENDRGLSIANAQAYQLVSKLGNKYTKRIPKWVKDSDRDVILAYIEEAVLGDGWNDKGHEAYATVSRGLADDMQELYVKAGRCSAMRTRPAKPYKIRGVSGSNTVDQYHVHRKNADKASLRNASNDPNFSTVHYEGMVYCATVPNGTLIVRRHGKVSVCGNCESQQAAAAWLLGAGLPAPPSVEAVASTVATTAAVRDDGSRGSDLLMPRKRW